MFHWFLSTPGGVLCCYHSFPMVSSCYCIIIVFHGVLCCNNSFHLYLIGSFMFHQNQCYDIDSFLVIINSMLHEFYIPFVHFHSICDSIISINNDTPIINTLYYFNLIFHWPQLSPFYLLIPSKLISLLHQINFPLTPLSSFHFIELHEFPPFLLNYY